MRFWTSGTQSGVDDQVSGGGTDHVYPAHAPTIIASAVVSFCSSWGVEIYFFEKQRPPHSMLFVGFEGAEGRVITQSASSLDFGRAKCGVEEQLSGRRQDLLHAPPITRAHRMSKRSFLHHMFLSTRNFIEDRDRHISLLVMCFGRKSRADRKAIYHLEERFGFEKAECGVEDHVPETQVVVLYLVGRRRGFSLVHSRSLRVFQTRQRSEESPSKRITVFLWREGRSHER